MSETAPVSVTTPSGSTLTANGVETNSAWKFEAELEKLLGPGWTVSSEPAPKRTVNDAPQVFLQVYKTIQSVAA